MSLDNIAKRSGAYKPKERVAYKMIKEYIEAKYGFKVYAAYFAEVKRELGLGTIWISWVTVFVIVQSLAA